MEWHCRRGVNGECVLVVKVFCVRVLHRFGTMQRHIAVADVFAEFFAAVVLIGGIDGKHRNRIPLVVLQRRLRVIDVVRRHHYVASAAVVRLLVDAAWFETVRVGKKSALRIDVGEADAEF